MKKPLVFILFILISIQIVSAKDWSQSTYEGFWADLAPEGEPSYGNTFLAIAKLENKEYLVISNSTRDSENLSFYGIGIISDDGTLVITTNNGEVWILARTTENVETVVILDSSATYDIAGCRRIKRGELSSTKILMPELEVIKDK